MDQVTQENIAGDILVELTEDVLELELGIAKKIHRLKLLKVINGSKPVTQYLKVEESSRMDSLC